MTRIETSRHNIGKFAVMSRGVSWVTSLTAIGVFVTVTSVVAGASPSSATETSTTDSTFLLAIGAPVSVGVQPTLRHAHGQPMHQG